MYLMKQSIPKVSLIIIQIKLCVVISILKKMHKKTGPSHKIRCHYFNLHDFHHPTIYRMSPSL